MTDHGHQIDERIHILAYGLSCHTRKFKVYFVNEFKFRSNVRVATNNVQLIVVYVLGEVCGLRMSQIIMGFYSVYLNYNTGLIELYYLSVTSLTQQGDFGLYILMG